jgi:hypothetical protein
VSKERNHYFKFPGFSRPGAGGGIAGIKSVQFLVATTDTYHRKLVWSKSHNLFVFSGDKCIFIGSEMVPGRSISWHTGASKKIFLTENFLGTYRASNRHTQNLFLEKNFFPVLHSNIKISPRIYS